MGGKTFCLSTLGCKVNQYESQLLREGLLKAGFTEVSSDKAKVAIVNTCTVTSQSDLKSRKAIRKFIGCADSVMVIVTGCGVNNHEKTFSPNDGLVFVGGTEFKDRFNGIISNIENKFNDIGLAHQGLDSYKLFITSFSGRSRAFVKVQDGCDSWCSYCAIPMARGASRSRDIGLVCDEVSALISNGYHEIVLTGIHLGQYRDSLGNGLPELIEKVAGIPGLLRLRLSSIEPQDITGSFIDVFSRYDKIMPHLHLPLQNGNNNVLCDMNRQYTIERYKDIVFKLRSAKPDLCITTDLIVGYPTETPDYFQDSLKNVLDIGFLKVHVFPFSARPGTKASLIEQKLPKCEIKSRSALAVKLLSDKSNGIKKSFVGKEFDILVESKNDKIQNEWSGFTSNYIKVVFSSGLSLYNKIVKVIITAVKEETLLGELKSTDGFN